MEQNETKLHFKCYLKLETTFESADMRLGLIIIIL
jgi:hypothetical protein